MHEVFNCVDPRVLSVVICALITAISFKIAYRNGKKIYKTAQYIKNKGHCTNFKGAFTFSYSVLEKIWYKDGEMILDPFSEYDGLADSLVKTGLNKAVALHVIKDVLDWYDKNTVYEGNFISCTITHQDFRGDSRLYFFVFVREKV